MVLSRLIRIVSIRGLVTDILRVSLILMVSERG